MRNSNDGFVELLTDYIPQKIPENDFF